MLARGFTMICLAIALTGMIAAILVAEGSRPHPLAGELISCAVEQQISCSR